MLTDLMPSNPSNLAKIQRRRKQKNPVLFVRRPSQSQDFKNSEICILTSLSWTQFGSNTLLSFVVPSTVVSLSSPHLPCVFLHDELRPLGSAIGAASTPRWQMLHHVFLGQRRVFFWFPSMLHRTRLRNNAAALGKHVLAVFGQQRIQTLHTLST